MPLHWDETVLTTAEAISEEAITIAMVPAGTPEPPEWGGEVGEVGEVSIGGRSSTVGSSP